MFCQGELLGQEFVFGLSSFRLLVIVVNPLFGLLEATTLADKVEEGVLVTDSSAGVSWSWVIACRR